MKRWEEWRFLGDSLEEKAQRMKKRADATSNTGQQICAIVLLTLSSSFEELSKELRKEDL